MSKEIQKFQLVGIVTCPEFQKCRCFLKSVHRGFPRAYQKPDVRPMLNVEWNEYLTKMRRKIGGKTWSLGSDLVVLLDDEVLGGEAELLGYLSTRFRLSVKRDFHKLGVVHLREILQETLDSGRRFAYMTIAADFKVIGTILILLYADLVPKTVDHFLKRCKRWPSTKIHRIVQSCWIQCAMSVKPRRMPCENYFVPHDRRGVLSTCNSAKHTGNSNQYNISLNPTPWMDYKYVAFGQVIQGDEILTFVQNIPTCYEKPDKDIEITACAEFVLDEDVVDIKTIKELETFLAYKEETGRVMDVEDARDVASELSVEKYMQGLYALPTDTMSWAHTLTPQYLQKIYEEERMHWINQTEEEEEDQQEEIPDDEQLHRTRVFLSRKDLRFKSDIYPKADPDSFKIEDVSPEKPPSGMLETISYMTVAPVPLNAHSELIEPTTNQYNPLYLDDDK